MQIYYMQIYYEKVFSSFSLYETELISIQEWIPEMISTEMYYP